MTQQLNILPAVILFCLITCCESAAQKGKILNPFDTLHFDKVIAYDYNGMNEQPIVKDGQLIKRSEGAARAVEIYGQKELTNAQMLRFHKILGDTSTYGGPTAACFDPHMGIVYYKKEKIVGYISICIDCNYLRASMPIPASEIKKKFIDEEKTIMIGIYGFSRSARKKLNDFCKELKFSTCKESLNSVLFGDY